MQKYSVFYFVIQKYFVFLPLLLTSAKTKIVKRLSKTMILWKK